MKSIQTTALILWMIIFISASFILGQFLVSKNIFDLTSVITGESSEKDTDDIINDDELSKDVVINKIGQETVRIGFNIAEDYFEDYYKYYIDYIMENIDKYDNKVVVNETLASDYVFYAVANNVDTDKYISSKEGNNIKIAEAEINSFLDKMFDKQIDSSYKNQSKYGYDKTNKYYNIEKVNTYNAEYVKELNKIENLTSNKVILTYNCKKINEKINANKNTSNTIKLTIEYTGGRYIVKEVEVNK